MYEYGWVLDGVTLFGCL